MKIIMYAMGTMGDIMPYVRIGAQLKEMGHEVVIISNEIAKRIAESFQLQFYQLSSRELFEETYFDNRTWTPEGGDDHFEKFHLAALAPAYQYVEACVSLGERPMIISQYEINGARMAASEFGLPFVNVVLAPSAIKSVQSPTFPLRDQVSPSRWEDKMPEMYQKMKEQFFTRHIKGTVNSTREALGLQPWTVEDVPEEGQAEHMVALFPNWLKQPPSDWPRHIHFAGFPGADNENDRNHEVVEAFIKANGPPLVFTIGSSVLCKEEEIEFAKEVCRALELPGIFVSPTVANIIQHVDEDFMCVKYMNFDRLLPKCRLLVHHGGIGTCASAIAGGVPQLIRPLTFDQPDNAFCLYELGVANAVSGHKLQSQSCVEVIGELLESKQVAKAVARAEKLMRDSDGISDCSQYIHDVSSRYTPEAGEQRSASSAM